MMSFEQHKSYSYKAACELGYQFKFIKRIAEATTDNEIDRAMIDGRNSEPSMMTQKEIERRLWDEGIPPVKKVKLNGAWDQYL